MLCRLGISGEKSYCSPFAYSLSSALFAFAGILAFATLLVPSASAQAAKTPQKCCVIKSINAATGIVSAADKTTGRTFQFSVKDQDLLNSLRVGQSVNANFNSKQVTIYGVEPCCQITSLEPPSDNRLGSQGVSRASPVDGSVSKVAPVDGSVSKVVPVDGSVSKVAPVDGSVSKVAPVDGSVSKVAPVDGSVSKVAPVDGSVSKVAPVDGSVSKVAPVDGSVSKLAPVDGIVTGIDASGLVSAKVPATGQMFQFRVNDASMLNSLRLGQSISANFSASQVTIYGADPCCSIVGGGAQGASGATLHRAPAGSSAAHARAPLATAESDLPGIRIEIQELKRAGDSVTLRFTLLNRSDKEFDIGYNFGGRQNVSYVYLQDSQTNTRYGSSAYSSDVPKIAAKSKAALWATFKIPESVTKVSVGVPHCVPLENVPISSGP